MTQVTSTGFLRTRLDERLEQLKSDFRAIYGSDIQIDPNSPDGQLIGTLADRISDIDQLAEDVYNSFNPQMATGLSLSRLVQLNGIRRRAGAYSTCEVSIIGSQGITIPSGSQIKSTTDGSLWLTTEDLLIGDSGTVTTTLKAKVMGPYSAAPGTLTKIDTPIYGWQSVTNATSATPGLNEETDEELRVRRRSSTATPGQTIVDAVYGALANLPEVRLARVYENYEDEIDDNGQDPHSIHCIVEGGDEDQIGQTIWNKKTAGTTPIGDITVAVTDTQGLGHTMKFSRPEYVDVYITVNITTLPGYPTGGADKIKDNLFNYGQTLTIGDTLLLTRLYSPVNNVSGHYINSIFIDTTPSPVDTDNIEPPFNGLIRIDQSRIVVNES